MDIGSWEFWRAHPMATDDFFRARLDSMIDMRHPLAVLTTRMPWAAIEAALAPLPAHKDRSGRVLQDADLFGPKAQLAGAGQSNAGRPRLPLRLMVALLHLKLLYLKHAFNLSDEELCERWSENVVWQFFSGMAYYEPRLPCDAPQIGRFRRVLGEAGVEQLLKSTIEASVSMGVLKRCEFERIIVDTTVQEKAIAHPTDSRLQSKSAAQGGRQRQALRHRAQADLRQAGQGIAPQSRRLC
jgi:transposase, IS5 family